LLTQADDVPAFSAGLARLIAEPGLRARMGDAARRRVQENFTSGRMARQFEEAYAGLAALPERKLGWSHTLRDVALPYSKLMRLRSPPPKARYAV
jgi:hypothetical protein